MLQQFTVSGTGQPAEAGEDALVLLDADGRVRQRLPWRHLLQVRVLGPDSAELAFAGRLPVVLTFADHKQLAQFRSALQSRAPSPDADAQMLSAPPHWT